VGNNREKPIIAVRGLVNRFGSETVHDGLDLDVFAGEVLGVVGGSGSGKSVLLRTIVGLNRPLAGRVEVFGTNVLRMNDAEQRTLEERWGVLFQDGALFSSLTVAQNIEVPLKEFYRMPQRLMDEIAALKIGLAGLPEDAGPKFPAQLSGGMRKRAGLARALALDPEIVFLDEPTAGLDPEQRVHFRTLLRELGQRATVVVSTHLVEDVGAACSEVALMDAGQIVFRGTPDELTVRGQDHGVGDAPLERGYSAVLAAARS